MSDAAGPTMSLPQKLYHATPLYRYDPGATDIHGVWDVRVHGHIKGHGLRPCTNSSFYVPAIYLTDEAGIASNYASNNFGEDGLVDWVVLEIDASALDEACLLPDLDHEAYSRADDILALGFTEDEFDLEEIPWWATLHVTGQVRYTAPIPDDAIRVHAVLRMEDESCRMEP
jgi:hypothetical protein